MGASDVMQDVLTTRRGANRSPRHRFDGRNLSIDLRFVCNYLYEQSQRKRSALRFATLAIVSCAPLLVWVTNTFPMTLTPSNCPSVWIGRLVSVGSNLALAVALSFAHILVSDGDFAALAAAQAVLLALGLHFMSHGLSYGLGALAALSLIITFCLLVELAYGDSPRCLRSLIVRPAWWTMLTVSLCSCLSFGLSVSGLLPYASGIPRDIVDDERKLVQNLEIVQSLYDMDEWDIGCAEGVKLIQTVVMVESRYLGIPPEEEPVVEMAPLPDASTVAHYNPERNTIVVSPYALRRTSMQVGPYAIYVACHEMAHAWQHRVIADPSILECTRMPLEVGEDRIEMWKSEFRDYVSGSDGNLHGYASQDCEIFANSYAHIALNSYASRLQSS